MEENNYSAISSKFLNIDGTLKRSTWREGGKFVNRNLSSMDNLQAFAAANRNYMNASGGHVDESVWVAGQRQVTSSTTEDGYEVFTTTQKLLRRNLKTTTTDLSFDLSMNHCPTLISRRMTNDDDDDEGLNILKNRPQQQNRLAMTQNEERQRMTILPDFEEKCNNRTLQLLRHRALNDQIGSKEICLKRSSDSCNFSDTTSSLDQFSSHMTNSFQSLVERQRNEFMRFFPQLDSKFAKPEVIVKSVKQPDGSEMVYTTTVARRQFEYRKTTTIVNGLVQSSTSRAIMVYGGPQNGFQMKFEQIQGSPEDSEDDDDDETKERLSITASDVDDDNASALVRLDDVKGVQEVKMRKQEKAWLSAKELVDTERRYVSKLHLLDQVFRPKVEQMQDKTVANDKISKLFSNLGSLYTFHHDHLLPSLEDRLREWRQSQKICDVMCKLADYLKMYSEYTNSYNKSTKIYYDLKRKSKRFAEIIQEIQAMPECENLPLDTHIICPVQRVARYHLLLRQYLDYLSPGHVDRHDTEIALEKVKESASHANNMMRKLDKYKDVIEVQEALGSQMQGLLTPSRELIKKGRLIKISRRGAGSQERHIFLFNDLLLLCSDRRMSLSKYKLRAALSFDGMQILDSDNLEFENTFVVRWRNKLIELLAKTPEDKTEWMEALWSSVQQYTKDRESFVHARSNGSDNRDGSKDISKTCSVCKSTFKFLWNDEYTCKLCKSPVCKKCTRKDSDEKRRVCFECCDKKKSQSFNNFNTELKSTENVDSAKQCVIKGNLEIRSTKTAYTNRFFILYSNSVLQSFKNETSAMGSSLLLHGSKVTLVDPRQDSAAPVNSFVFKVLHPNRVYYFKTATEADLIKWMAAVELASQAEPSC